MDNESALKQTIDYLIGKNVKVRDKKGNFFKAVVAGSSAEWVFFKKGKLTSMMRFDSIESIIERKTDESNNVDHQNKDGGS